MIHILLSNDDGIMAQGLQALRKCFDIPYYRISVVAPLLEMSAVSHGITTNGPIRMQEIRLDSVILYGIEGTPADCVKFALQYLLKDDPPNIVISGINQGSNTGFNIHYSGTVAAAFEGLFAGLPSIAISVTSFQWCDFEPFFPYIRKIVTWWSKEKKPEFMLNLNFPPVKDIKGIKIVKQGLTKYRERLIPQEDPRGRTYFWLGGDFEPDSSMETEETNLALGFATLSPLKFDLTHHRAINSLKKLWENG